MTRSHFRKFCLAASLVLAAGPLAATPTAGAEARIDRLTDALVELMPIGRIFENVAASEPAWPVQDMLDQVSATELVCLRGELSTPGFRRLTRARVVQYAEANPARLDEDIALLAKGASELHGRLIMAGFEGERAGVAVDPEAVLAGATEEQLGSFLSFSTDVRYQGLREIVGVRTLVVPGATREESEKAGEEMGVDLTRMLMTGALETCGVGFPESKE